VTPSTNSNSDPLSGRILASRYSEALASGYTLPSQKKASNLWGTLSYPRKADIGTAASNPQSGLTLVELIICVTIVAILATAAIPLARFEVKRNKERELRRDLWEMRDAIDHYKDAADKGAFMTKADSFNYPPDLQTLVDGVDVQDKKVKFLRKIPTDPMTGSTDWGLRSNQDDTDSDSFGGQDVFNVYTKSTGTALDGTKYSTW
jgi:general secretion pathway protein G